MSTSALPTLRQALRQLPHSRWAPLDLSEHRWTSTWDSPSSVSTAGPQPGTLPSSVSTAGPQPGTLPSSVSTAGPQRPDRMPEDMPDRMPEGMPDRMPEVMPDRLSDRMPMNARRYAR